MNKFKPKLKINYKELKNCIFESTFNTADKDCIDLMKKMLCANPKKRINIDEVLLHPYLSGEDDYMECNLLI